MLVNMKMRETIKRIRDGVLKGEASSGNLAWIVNLCDECLAMPPRNCDVGTAEEQAMRYKIFCENHSGWDGQKRFGCLNCQFIDVDECEFAWAQMPYNEQEESKS